MNEDNVRENEMNSPEPADEAAAEVAPEISTDEVDSAAEAEAEAEHVETDSESKETEDVGSSSAETEPPAEEPREPQSPAAEPAVEPEAQAADPAQEVETQPADPAEEAEAMPAVSPDAPEEPVETPVTFQDFNLTSSVMQAIDKMGFVEPTPIQKKSLPLVLEGRDLLGQAQTGTGKTAAFGIPMAQNLDPEGPVQALVLCPTRELAVQVSEELHELSLFSGQKVLPIYGGQRIDRQINALKKGVQIIAGTPGRVLDHLGRGTLDLTGLRMLILDEADMMLDMGFLPDIRRILRQCPEDRQTMLFSATIPDDIRNISDRYMRDPVSVSVVPETLTLDDTEQIFYELPEDEKLEALTHLLDYEDESASAMIFCRTRRNVERLARKLKGRGYEVEGLHGDLTQQQRDRIMEGFRGGEFPYLVATDVASRGLDISHVTHVINYHIPQDPEAYVHRIGRTGRMGRSGVAITFVTPAEYWDLLRIQEFSHAQIEEGELPSAEEMEERRRAARGDEAAQESVRRQEKARREESVAVEQPAIAEALATVEPGTLAASAAIAPDQVEEKPRRPRERRRPGKGPRDEEKRSSFFDELRSMTEGAQTEAERHQRRYTLRDIDKRIEVTGVEEVLKEADRLEREALISEAQLQAEREAGGQAQEASARGALEDLRRRERAEAEQLRRKDVEERMRDARHAEEIAAKKPARPVRPRPSARPEPVAQTPVAAVPEMPAIPGAPLTPAEIRPAAMAELSEEERILRALQLRDHLSGRLQELDSHSVRDYLAVIDRLAVDFAPKLIAAFLLGAYSQSGAVPFRREPEEKGKAAAAPGRKPEEGDSPDENGDMTRLFISIGRRAKVNRQQLEDLVRETAGIHEEDIGRIDLLHRFAFIEVRKAIASKVIETMQDTVFRGREISVERAKSRPGE